METEKEIEEGVMTNWTDEMKAEYEANKERRKLVNAQIEGFLATIEKEFGLKANLIAYDPKLDQVGMWQSKNVTEIEKYGFSKISEGAI